MSDPVHRLTTVSILSRFKEMEAQIAGQAFANAAAEVELSAWRKRISRYQWALFFLFATVAFVFYEDAGYWFDALHTYLPREASEFRLLTKEGRVAAHLFVEQGTPALDFYDVAGKARLRLGVSASGPAIELYNKTGATRRVYIDVDEQDEPCMMTVDAAGKAVSLRFMDDEPSRTDNFLGKMIDQDRIRLAKLERKLDEEFERR